MPASPMGFPGVFLYALGNRVAANGGLTMSLGCAMFLEWDPRLVPCRPSPKREGLGAAVVKIMRKEIMDDYCRVAKGI